MVINMRENPVSVRSKLMLTNALQELMCSKVYEKISIKEITDHAGLARMTFYTNFKVKDDILIYFCHNLLSCYKDNLAKYSNHSVEIIALEFFNLWKYHQQFVKSLTPISMKIVMEQAEIFMTEIVAEYDLTPTFKEPSKFQKYEWIFLVGGLMNMTSHWIKNGCIETPDQMAYIFNSIGMHRS